jgi:hypothetical protein
MPHLRARVEGELCRALARIDELGLDQETADLFTWVNMTRVLGLQPLGQPSERRTDDGLRRRVNDPPVAATGSAPIAPITFSFARQQPHGWTTLPSRL